MDEFRLLGPLEAIVGGDPIRLAAQKPRALLALLLLDRNRVVATDRLVDELWGDAPPAQATKTLQVYVSQLRKELGPERLATRAPGYELRVADGELDLDRFDALVRTGREQLAAGDAAAAASTLRDALALWRGPALQEFRSEPFAGGAAARLEELRLGALEDRLQAELDAGAAADVVPELEQLVVSEPLRERPRELLMLALYRSGRQADALDLYRRARELFVEELGIEPGPALRELEQAILRQDAALAAPRRARGVVAAAAPTPLRRRRRLLGAATLAAAIIAAALVVAFVPRGSHRTSPPANPELRVFVYTIENFLVQSQAGRAEARHAIAGAAACKISPRVAVARLTEVQQNRQSLLQQLAALRVPGGRAPRVTNFLQQAIHASMTADLLYRNWLRPHRSCPLGAPPAATRIADVHATAVKRAFVAAFNPLARRFRQRVWQADQF